MVAATAAVPQTVLAPSGLVPGLASVANDEWLLWLAQGGVCERSPSRGGDAAMLCKGAKSASEKLFSAKLGLLRLVAAHR